jgi:long-chain-fatty-acid--CoA ligase ACSBG
LSHVAAQLVDIVAPLFDGINVFFVDVTALQGNLSMFLTEIRPTIFMTVPRLWEKIFDKIDLMINTSGGIKKRLFGWARSIGK